MGVEAGRCYFMIYDGYLVFPLDVSDSGNSTKF